MADTAGQIVCDCRICSGKGSIVSRRTRKRHIETYGMRESSDFEISSEPDPLSGMSDWDFDSHSDQDLPFYQEEEINMSSNNLEDNTLLSHDYDTEWADRSHASSSVSLTSSESDDSMSSCSNSEEETFGEKENVWSLQYDKDLYSSGIAVKKLDGTDLTVLQWLALNFNSFCNHPSMSKEAFNDSLRINKITNPANKDSLPSSYYEAKKMLFPFLLKRKVFQVCINGCIIFRNSDKYQYEDLTKCPVCNEDRYYSTSLKRPTAKKTFSYLPVGPRLARIYGEANLAQIVQAHIQSDEIKSDGSNRTEMWDIHDSPAWKELYSEKGYFQGDRLGISFALELDGVNPYHNIGVMYSMTPIMLTILNLPRNIRNTFRNIMLCSIIPGQNRSEASNLDPYVEILVDELIYLTKCTAYSEYHKAPVQVKLKLLLYILDYPGLSKLFHIHGSGSLCGCHWCHIRGFHSSNP